MKTRIYFLIAFFFLIQQLNAQLFVDKAVIEYEVKVNIKKTMGNGSWDEMIKENLPQFKTGYFTYTFADNKSIYKFDHWDVKKVPEWMRRNDEESIWYFDHDANKMNMQKNLYGSNLNVEDSMPVIEWRLTNENRIIAGYNCRKAVGKIMDSVYVFAFYTNEINISGGPCSINGLPGMILGVTIPRMYASWIATKVTLNNVDLTGIKPITSKKYYTLTTFKSVIKERIKQDNNSDDPDEKKWVEQFYWNTLL